MTNSAESDQVFLFAGFRLDPRRRLLQAADGKHLPLTGRAFDTLLFLVAHPNQLVDRRALMDAVWPNLAVEDNNLNQNISIVRRTLGEAPGEHRFIVTVPGRGFRFVPAVTRGPETAQPTELPAAVAGAPSDSQSEPIAVEANAVRPRRGSRGLFVAGLCIMVVATGATMWWRRHTAVQPVAKPDIAVTLPPRTVAVLPFENISGDSHNDYLALGIAEMVLNRLASVRELLVIARTSAFQFPGQESRRARHRSPTRRALPGRGQCAA